MRIALITNLYPPYIIGGNEMLARDVVEALRQRGHRVHVITGRGGAFPQDGYLHPVLDLDLDRKEESFLGGRKPSIPEQVTRHLFNPLSYRAVRQTLTTIRPDLVIGWNLYMASMAPLVAARRLGLPTVIHVCDKWLLYSLRDVEPLVWPDTRWKKAAVRMAQLTVQPLLYRLTDPRCIIAISRFMRDVYVRADFPKERFEVIHLGVPTEVFTPPAERPSNDGAVRLLYIGQLWEGKGPQVMLEALAELVHRRGLRGVHLDVCGEGTEKFKGYLRRIVRRRGLEKIVTFHGFVSRDRVLEFYQSRDILIFPSIWDEPFAAVPVEAMSCGMAIVATTAGGTSEAISDGETGLLVPSGDPVALAGAMGRLACDPHLRQRLGQRAAAVARERFDFATYVDRLEGYYARVVNTSPENREGMSTR